MNVSIWISIKPNVLEGALKTSEGETTRKFLPHRLSTGFVVLMENGIPRFPHTRIAEHALRTRGPDLVVREAPRFEGVHDAKELPLLHRSHGFGDPRLIFDAFGKLRTGRLDLIGRDGCLGHDFLESVHQELKELQERGTVEVDRLA